MPDSAGASAGGKDFSEPLRAPRHAAFGREEIAMLPQPPCRPTRHPRPASAWLLCAAVSLLAACQGSATPSGSAPAGDANGADSNTAVGQMPISPSTPAPTQNGNGATVAPGATAPQQPNRAAIAYLGRFDTVTDEAGPTMAWPASEILIGFNGTKLTVTLAGLDQSTYFNTDAQARLPESNYVAYSVDGAATSTLKIAFGKSGYVVAQNLPAGQHTVRLSKMTEASVGRVQFLGAVTDGTLSYNTPASGRRLEFIGDSGMAGYGILGTSPCVFSPETENGDLAYPAVVGRLLNAETRNLSYSGKGLLQNRDPVNDDFKTLPVLWQRALPFDNPYVLWDANQWQPQAVVAMISGNDVYVGVPSQATVTAKLTAFVTALRTAYPKALLLFGASPMLRTDDPRPGQRALIIARLQSALASIPDANLAFLDVPQDLGFNGPASCAESGKCFGCDGHMSVTTHNLTAAAVAKVLKEKLAW